MQGMHSTYALWALLISPTHNASPCRARSHRSSHGSCYASSGALQRPHLLRFVSPAEDRCDAQTPDAAQAPRLTGYLLRKLPARQHTGCDQAPGRGPSQTSSSVSVCACCSSSCPPCSILALPRIVLRGAIAQPSAQHLGLRYSPTTSDIAMSGWWCQVQAGCAAREPSAPGWCQDQHRRAVRTRRRPVPSLPQPLGAREQVPQGFAAAGLRDRLHIPPCQARRPAPTTGTLVVSG